VSNIIDSKNRIAAAVGRVDVEMFQRIWRDNISSGHFTCDKLYPC
jgi:hypothetical protein